MRNTAVILLAAIATLGPGATSQVLAVDAMKAAQALDDPLYGPQFVKDHKDFVDATKTVQRLRDEQHAKCEMDADQYIDERSLAGSSLTGDQLKSLMSARSLARYELCMEAVGYPARNHTLREITADTYRRMRELWVASGKSQIDLDSFDQFVDRLQSSLKD